MHTDCWIGDTDTHYSNNWRINWDATADHSDVTSLLYSICNFDFVVTIGIVQMCLAFKKSLLERSLDIGRALKSVTLGQSSLDCKANVEQFNHQWFERSVKIYEPLDIEVNKPRICGETHNER